MIFSGIFPKELIYRKNLARASKLRKKPESSRIKRYLRIP
jgi:hypothetical protein